MERVIGLVDCNSFFCSCERLFRPDLREKPVIVLSNNDGCVVARTKEAKLLNISAGVPYFKVKDICEKNRVEVFSANFSLYSDISMRVMNKLQTLAPKVEIYSIDEAFLDFTGVPNIREYAEKIKIEIEREIGIPVSVGISRTKVLAKLASGIAKKGRGVAVLLDQEEIQTACSTFPVGEIWGVGRKSDEKLKRIGVRTAYDLVKMESENILSLLTKSGLVLRDELLSIPILKVEDGVSKKESIMSSRSFGEKVTSLAIIKRAIAHHTSIAAEKLREQESYAGKITVFMRTNFFGDGPHYSGVLDQNFNSPLFDTRELIKSAFRLADQVFRSGYLYAKCGVVLTHLQDEQQLDLFQAEKAHKSGDLMRVMDQINEREGPLFLKSAACGTDDKDWFMKQSKRSPRYLTSWSDLPVVE